MSVQPEETLSEYGEYESCVHCGGPLLDCETDYGECDACIWKELEEAGAVTEIYLNSEEDYDAWVDRMLTSDWSEDDNED